MTCSDCKYAKSLVNTKESYFTCSWFDDNDVEVPVWCVVQKFSGAIWPRQSDCPVFEAKYEK